MANLFDFLSWRGDLPFEAVPPGEADELLLAQLSYVFFDGIVPGLKEGGAVPLGEAARQLLKTDPDAKQIHQIGYMWRDDKRLLETLIDCPRYQRLPIFGYESALDEDAQFGALCIRVTDELTCVSFRGTDDTLIGWKEDCALSFNDPVPAQQMSADYLRRVAEATKGPLLVVGHSKGGNLAVYSAATAGPDVRARIQSIVSCDGPGVNHALFDAAEYREIADRIFKFVPQSSVVGMLFESDNRYAVISSDGLGLLQHSAFSWQIMGGRLVRREQPTATSKYFNGVIKQWLDDMDVEKRKVFVTALFEVLATTELTSVDQIDAKFLLRLPGALVKMRSVDPTLRAQLRGEIRALLWRALHPDADAADRDTAPEAPPPSEQEPPVQDDAPRLSLPPSKPAPEKEAPAASRLTLPERPQALRF